MEYLKKISVTMVTLTLGVSLIAVVTGSIASVLALQAAEQGVGVHHIQDQRILSVTERRMAVRLGLHDACLLADEIYCISNDRTVE